LTISGLIVKMALSSRIKRWKVNRKIYRVKKMLLEINLALIKYRTPRQERKRIIRDLNEIAKNTASTLNKIDTL
jgi:hypothetical protein